MKKSALFAIAAAALFSTAASTEAQVQVRVDITSNAPDGGVALTPVWVGFHNGSFDSYNRGEAVAAGLERVAEDGDTGQITTDFGNGLSYASTGVTQSGTRVQGTIGSPDGPPPIQPNQSVSQLFNIANDGTNRYFSYASMVLPSNDFFVANGSATAHDLSSLYDGDGFVEFQIGLNGSVLDAGTEINDFADSPGNGLFGIDAGQSAADQGTPEGGVVTTAPTGNPYAGFLNQDFANNADFANGPLNFNNYTNGVATVRITAVQAIPEPSAAAFLALAVGGLAIRRRRNNA